MSDKTKKPTHTIIFDLDGTLADTWPVAFKMANDMNLLGRQISEEEYQRVRNMHAKEMLEFLDIPFWRVPKLLVKGRAALAERIVDVPVFPGMEEALKTLKKNGYELCIMSSNSLENVQKFLANHNLSEYFIEVQGGIGVFAKAKTLKKFVKEREGIVTDMYYVGDEVRDVEAAKKVGLHAISVTWGINGEKILSEYKPDYIVHTPAELTALFKDRL
jgi:phosphoglycolate phosphatase-like HAD superfamily hydrolase